MTEHPLFVPYQGEHIAAVLTLPEGEPRGLVLLARSIRGRMWVRTARALAERGIASVRMDYLGTGDSTGRYRSERQDSSVPWGEAVLDLAQRITGVSRLGALGHCRDARRAVGLAARIPEMGTIVLLVRGPRGLATRARRTPGGGRGQPRVTSRWRRLPGRLTRRLLGKKRRRTQWRFGPQVSEAARSTDIVLVLIGPADRKPRFERLLDKLRASAAGAGHHIELRHLPGVGRHGFRVPAERREEVAQTLAGWLGETIDRPLPMPEGGLAGPTTAPAVERPALTGGSP